MKRTASVLALTGLTALAATTPDAGPREPVLRTDPWRLAVRRTPERRDPRLARWLQAQLSTDFAALHEAVFTPAPPHAELLCWQAFVERDLAAWQALWQASGADPDLSPMWQQALVHSHGIDQRNLHVVAVRDAQERLLMVWPIQVQARGPAGLQLVKIAPVQNVFCMHAGVLSRLDEASSVALLLQALQAQPWHWLQIDGLAAGSALHRAWLSACEQQGLGTHQQCGERPPYLQHTGTLEDFLAPRSKKFRKKVRGLLRDAHDDDQVQVRVYRQAHELPQYQAAALAIEARSWKHAAGSAITSRDWEQAFYAQLIAGLGPQGCLIGAVLFIAGTPVAHSLDVQHGRRVFGLKSSFDAAYAKSSPGNMLMVHQLDTYFETGCTEYDFLGKDEDYKREWTATVRQHMTLRIYNGSAAGRTLGAVDGLRRKA